MRAVLGAAAAITPRWGPRSLSSRPQTADKLVALLGSFSAKTQFQALPRLYEELRSRSEYTPPVVVAMTKAIARWGDKAKAVALLRTLLGDFLSESGRGKALKEHEANIVAGAIVEALGGAGAGARVVREAVQRLLSRASWPLPQLLEGITVAAMHGGDVVLARTALSAHADSMAVPSFRTVLAAWRATQYAHPTLSWEESGLAILREVSDSTEDLTQEASLLRCSTSSSPPPVHFSPQSWSRLVQDDLAFVTTGLHDPAEHLQSYLSVKGTDAETKRWSQWVVPLALLRTGTPDSVARARDFVARVCARGGDWAPESLLWAIGTSSCLLEPGPRPFLADGGDLLASTSMSPDRAVLDEATRSLLLASVIEWFDLALAPTAEHPVEVTPELVAALVDFGIASGQVDSIVSERIIPLLRAAKDPFLPHLSGLRGEESSSHLSGMLWSILVAWTGSPPHAPAAVHTIDLLSTLVEFSSSSMLLAGLGSHATQAWVVATRNTQPPSFGKYLDQARAVYGTSASHTMEQMVQASVALGKLGGSADRGSFQCPTCGYAASPASGPFRSPKGCPSLTLTPLTRMVEHPLSDQSVMGRARAPAWLEWSMASSSPLPPHLGLSGSRLLLPSRLVPLIDRTGELEPKHRERLLRRMLDASLSVPCAAEAWWVFQTMLEAHIAPSPTQLRGLRAACALGGQIVRAWEAHSRLAKAEHPPSGERAGVLPSWGSLLRDAPGDLLPFAESSSSSLE
jgi:hypothetical protein